ncbi:MAG: LamG-like jellyroll fold domain-containing protein [Pirellulales bacterium]
MDARIAKLFHHAVEQELTSEQACELDEKLRTDAAAADALARLLQIHFALAEREAPVRAFSLEELRAIDAVDKRFDASLAAAATNAAKASDGQTAARRWMTAFSIAATALIAVSVWSLWGQNRELPRAAAPANQPAEFGDDAIARVKRKIDCDWSDDRWQAASSGRVRPGQLITLNKGLLVLEFKSGAEVTLNGPATLVAISEMGAKLVKGELSARVPPPAHGFRIETHAGDFVDLGTEFGLLVSEDGEVQTHVFKGEVEAQSPAGQGKAVEKTSLKTNEAWSRSPAGEVEHLAAQPEKFLLPLHNDEPKKLPPPPIDRALALWYSADGEVQVDGTGGVSEWGDNVVGANVQHENAWQVSEEKRPKFIPQSIGGKPALRFDGYKSLVTEPMKLGTNQTSLVVFRVDREVARELVEDRTEYRELGVQLLNLNGPPHSVLQVNGNLSLEARVHLGYVPDKTSPVDKGRVFTTKELDNKPHIVAYTFDTINTTARLFVDGESVAETTDVPKQLDGTYASRYIGSHYDRSGFGFTGDIAEVLVYDGALAPAECQSVSAWLGKKYGIVTDHTATSQVTLRTER